MLERKAELSPRRTNSLDELIQFGNENAERAYAKYLISHIEGVSRRFEELQKTEPSQAG